MRKIKAKKPIPRIDDEITVLLQECVASIVFHEVKPVSEARATDGVVQLVYLSTRTEYQPDVDVACLLHFSPRDMRSSIFHQLCKMVRLGFELWYWRDQFWIKGVDKLGTPWYQVIEGTRCHALYPIEVVNGDQLLATIWSKYAK